MEKLNLQVEDQHQDQPDPIEEDTEEDDEGPLHAEDLSQTDSSHGGATPAGNVPQNLMKNFTRP